MKNNLPRRLIMYTAGLFAMTVGIALSVKSRLGVSPISSIPYAMTCIWGIEMGKATIILHCALVLLQILLLRKRFKPVNLLQVVVGIVFGYFTTFCNWCVSFLPDTDSMVLRVILLLLSVVCIALGIFLYMPPDIMALSGLPPPLPPHTADTDFTSSPALRPRATASLPQTARKLTFSPTMLASTATTTGSLSRRKSPMVRRALASRP